MGLFLCLKLGPTQVVLDIADDCLVRVYGDVLDRNLLLASIAVVIEPFGRHDHRALHCRPLLTGRVMLP